MLPIVEAPVLIIALAAEAVNLVVIIALVADSKGLITESVVLIALIVGVLAPQQGEQDVFARSGSVVSEKLFRHVVESSPSRLPTCGRMAATQQSQSRYGGQESTEAPPRPDEDALLDRSCELHETAVRGTC